MAGQPRGIAADTGNSRDTTDELVTALLTASRALIGISARSLEGLEDGGVTVPQFRTLVVLDNEGEINLNRLAEILDVNASSAMRMVDRLIAAGLVARRENPDNRRQVLIDLSSDGRSAVRRVTSRRRREIRKIVTRMDDRDATELIRALRSFAGAANEPNVETGTASSLGW